jgi:glycosyltransferase involved in cell wall biosynthesis
VTRRAGWPAVDVVVPTRDRRELLRRSIDAILGQEYPGEIRVLVVHDQSEPDRSVERDVLDPCGQRRRVEVIENVRTVGLAGARNSGILHATAPLVAFCDDDDLWLPGKLRRQVTVLKEDPAAAFVCTGIRIRYADHTHDRTLPQARIELRDLLRDRLVELHPSTFLMRREAVAGFGLVEEAIPGSYAEDYEFLLRAARWAPIRNVPEVGVEALWHEQSYFDSRWATIATALTWLLDRYPEFGDVPSGEARVTGQIAFASAAQGQRREAVRWARYTLRRNPSEPRAYLALGVASGAVKADTVVRRLHARGRGV